MRTLNKLLLELNIDIHCISFTWAFNSSMSVFYIFHLSYLHFYTKKWPFTNQTSLYCAINVSLVHSLFIYWVKRSRCKNQIQTICFCLRFRKFQALIARQKRLIQLEPKVYKLWWNIEAFLRNCTMSCFVRLLPRTTYEWKVLKILENLSITDHLFERFSSVCDHFRNTVTKVRLSMNNPDSTAQSRLFGIKLTLWGPFFRGDPLLISSYYPRVKLHRHPSEGTYHEPLYTRHVALLVIKLSSVKLNKNCFALKKN